MTEGTATHGRPEIGTTVLPNCGDATGTGPNADGIVAAQAARDDQVNDAERMRKADSGAGPMTASGADSSGTDDADGPTTGVVVRSKPKTKKPSMYKVLMLNDDYTPMEFVVHVLETVFHKSREEATKIMLHVHRRGVGVCGVYTYEVAETKVNQVMDFARRHQHPLQCIVEKSD